MKSYSTLLSLYGTMTNNIQTDNLNFGAEMMNDGYRLVLGMMEWPFLERTLTLTTQSAVQYYTAPAYLSKPASVTITVGNQTYTPNESPSRQFWDRLNIVNNITSDYPEYWYYFNGQIGIYPIPASSGNTITITSKVSVKDLTFADYTTGSITTVTNGTISVVGSGTGWTQPMTARFIKIDQTNSNNSGDDFWYTIGSVVSATQLNLERAYGGSSITAGSVAYVIGQVPLFPENYQMLPVWYAVAEYWDQNEDTGRAEVYRKKYNDKLTEMIKEFGDPTSGVVLDYGRTRRINNPNLFIQQS